MLIEVGERRFAPPVRPWWRPWRRQAEEQERLATQWRRAPGDSGSDYGCVIQITVIGMLLRYRLCGGGCVMANIGAYEGWWDLSLIDERNERPLHAAFVAVIAVWTTAFLLALV
jgi:hypothetical protein